jgi:SpoVK/Ycf46/Vps4 family AAA+-type ATPase
MPDADDRYSIFKSHLDSIGHDILVNDLRIISRATSGFVSSDLAQIVRNAHIMALKSHDKKAQII